MGPRGQLKICTQVTPIPKISMVKVVRTKDLIYVGQNATHHCDKDKHSRKLYYVNHV